MGGRRMSAALRAHVSLYKLIADHFRKALAAAFRMAQASRSNPRKFK
jgi:hypothetical protein